jgi:hypothetical protein
MSKVNGYSTDWKGRTTVLTKEDIDTEDLLCIHITDTPVFSDASFATNVIDQPGRLRYFEGSAVINAPADGIIRTTFYDTSGVPTETDTVLFSFLSFSEKVSGSTRGYQAYNFMFPGKGLIVKNGIGFKTQQLDGSPTFVAVDGVLYFHQL